MVHCSMAFGVILNYLFPRGQAHGYRRKKEPSAHVVEKKVPYIDENGTKEHKLRLQAIQVRDTHPLFDMVYMMDNSLPFEVDRERRSLHL